MGIGKRVSWNDQVTYHTLAAGSDGVQRPQQAHNGLLANCICVIVAICAVVIVVLVVV